MHCGQVHRLCSMRVQTGRQRRIGGCELRQQLRADGQQIATGQGGDLPDVAKRGPHDFGGDAVFFVVVENRTHRLHARVLRAGHGGFVPSCSRRLFVPVINAAHKGRDQLHLGLATGHRLAKGKQECQVATNPLTFEFRRGLDAFPSGRHFDQHPLACNALGRVQSHDAVRPRHGGRSVKTQTCIDLGRDATRNRLQNLAAKTHQQMVHHHIQRLAEMLGHGLREQGRIFRLLDRFQNQRRVGRRILRLELGQLFEITGVGHHSGELFERVELVHGCFSK